eukprot:CFRG5370T1
MASLVQAKGAASNPLTQAAAAKFSSTATASWNSVEEQHRIDQAKPAVHLHKHKVKPPTLVNLFAGGLGGMVGAIVTSPFEVVKTRLQSTKYTVASGKHLGVLDFVKDIYKSEGPRALYKGLTPALIGIVPARSIYFFAYTRTKHELTHLNGGKDNSWIHVLSASCSGFTTNTLTNPIWVVKTRMQLSTTEVKSVNASTAHRMISSFKQIYAEAGLKGFFRGLTASYAGISETILQFVIYEHLKKKISAHNANQNNGQPLSTSSVALQTVGIAASAKLFACMFTYPHEVIRTRMREPPTFFYPVSYTKFFPSLIATARYEGIVGLYSGFSAHLCRVLPNTAIMFTCYELVIRLWEKRQDGAFI